MEVIMENDGILGIITWVLTLGFLSWALYFAYTIWNSSRNPQEVKESEKNPDDHYDYGIDRNRKGRWIFLIISILSFLLLPGLLVIELLDTIISDSETIDWLWVPTMLLSAYFGSKAFSRVVHKYFIDVPQVQGFVTIDTLKALLGFSGSTYVIYGPGLHVAYPWEDRSSKSNFSLEVFTLPIKEHVPGKESQLLVSGAYQFEVALSKSVKFIGIDENTIQSGALEIIKAHISQKLADKDANDAKSGLKEINSELTNLFGLTKSESQNDTDSKVANFHERYGIRTTAVTISGIDLPEAVQRARDAVDEANQVVAGIAKMYGMNDENLKKRLSSTKEDPNHISFQEYNEMVDRFAAKSGNAKMDIKAIKIHGIDGLADVLKLFKGGK